MTISTELIVLADKLFNCYVQRNKFRWLPLLNYQIYLPVILFSLWRFVLNFNVTIDAFVCKLCGAMRTPITDFWTKSTLWHVEVMFELKTVHWMSIDFGWSIGVFCSSKEENMLSLTSKQTFNLAKTIAINPAILSRTKVTELKIKWQRPERIPRYNKIRSGDLGSYVQPDQSNICLQWQMATELEE